MSPAEYRKRVEEILQKELNVDSPDSLYKEAAAIESLAYLAALYQSKAELKLSVSENNIRLAKEKWLTEHPEKGTVSERQIKLEASLSQSIMEAEQIETEIRYWKQISKLIENKVSLAQSILSNISSSIKAGLYLDNIK